MLIQNEEIKALLVEKKELFDKGIKLTEQIEELDNERNTLAMLGQKVKEKMLPIVDRDVKPLLGEFEVMETFKLNDDGEVEVTTFDALEEFKKQFKENNQPKEEIEKETQ